MVTDELDHNDQMRSTKLANQAIMTNTSNIIINKTKPSTNNHPEYLPTLSSKHLEFLTKDQIHALISLQDEFEVTKEKLKSIVDEFEEEFRTGLSSSVRSESKTNGDVPRGDEEGVFLALDLGGTNLRVCEVNLNGDKTFEIRSSKYTLTDELKTGTAKALFEYIAECVQTFLIETGYRSQASQAKKDQHQEQLYLGFTFSFPVLQTALDKGKLLGWTKGFKATGAVGQDVVKLLQDSLDRRELNVRCNALVNDTVGTLMARGYQSGSALIGAIFGTGTNGAYVERLESVKKLEESRHPEVIKTAKKMIINTEWGAFDNLRNVLPITKYDNKLDRLSINPRRQTLEKMISGMYLGELTRNVIIEFIDRGLLFNGYSSEKLNGHYGFDTAVMSAIESGLEEEGGEGRRKTEELMIERFGIRGDRSDWIMIERVCELIGTRAARLSATAIGAVIKQVGADKSKEKISIGVDGSVIERYEKFLGRMRGGLRDLLDESVCDRIEIELTKDGSGVGAALCALQAKKQLEEGR